MRLDITISTDHKEEAVEVLQALVQSLGGKQVQITTTQKADEKEPQKETTSKRQKQKVETRTEVEVETTVTEPSFTVAQMQKKLAGFKNTKGLEAAAIKEVIQSFGVDKLSDMNPKDYNALLKKVESL